MPEKVAALRGRADEWAQDLEVRGDALGWLDYILEPAMGAFDAARQVLNLEDGQQ
jgi:hypothetical protein